jgi:NAD(P)H-dependent FMN reductase
MNKILIIVGTVREGRVGRKIADWYVKEAVKLAPHMEFEILDVAELNLPLFHEASPPMMHQYGEIQQKLAEKIASADGFVFITGEYNHSIPGSLKNFLDHLFSEWNYKAAAFVGYGGSAGGSRAIEHLIGVMTELKVASVASTPDSILIRNIFNAIDENGSPKPEFVSGDIARQLKDLDWWTSALKTARSK